MPAQADACWAMMPQEPCVYQKGDTIYDSRLAQKALAVIDEGQVRVFHGNVRMNTLGTGDVFGAAALFGEEEPYFSRVVAAQPCRIRLIPQETVAMWMARYPRVAENYVRYLSDKIRFLNRRLATLTAGQTDGKLWQYCVTHRDDAGRVSVPAGLSGLAESLGMGRSSLYRGLDELVLAGKITRHGKDIIVTDEKVGTQV